MPLNSPHAGRSHVKLVVLKLSQPRSCQDTRWHRAANRAPLSLLAASPDLLSPRLAPPRALWRPSTQSSSREEVGPPAHPPPLPPCCQPAFKKYTLATTRPPAGSLRRAPTGAEADTVPVQPGCARCAPSAPRLAGFAQRHTPGSTPGSAVQRDMLPRRCLRRRRRVGSRGAGSERRWSGFERSAAGRARPG